jgi:hypothetical protein
VSDLLRLLKGFVGYHGSPHKFDRFDLGRIGTGEGAQSFGTGAYVAELEDVARGYTRAGAGSDLSRLRDPGYLYQVRVGSDPESFLTLDKLLRQQPDNVQRLLRDWRVTPEPSPLRDSKVVTGHDALRALQNRFFEREIERRGGAWPRPDEVPTLSVQSSAELAERGIPGVKYLDGGSREAGSGSHNYVVFDPSTIDILKRYAPTGLLSAALLQPGSAEAKTAPAYTAAYGDPSAPLRTMVAKGANYVAPDLMSLLAGNPAAPVSNADVTEPGKIAGVDDPRYLNAAGEIGNLLSNFLPVGGPGRGAGGFLDMLARSVVK